MGAIAGPTRVLDHQLIRDLRISDEQVEAVVAREMKEVERREKLYRGGLPAPNLRGRTVVIVDDISSKRRRSLNAPPQAVRRRSASGNITHFHLRCLLTVKLRSDVITTPKRN